MDCPSCHANIPPDDVNVAADTAMCRGCGELSRPSDAVAGERIGLGDASPDEPPSGCSFEDDGLDRVWRASTRSWTLGGFFLLFSTFWCLVTSVFVALLSAATLNAIGIDTGFKPEIKTDSGAPFGDSTGELLIGWLFMTPFILIGLGTATFAFVSLAGSLEVRVRQSEGVVRTGWGPLSLRKKFDASRVTRVANGLSSFRVNNRRQPLLELEHGGAGGKIRFGSTLSRPRLAWLTVVLRRDLKQGGDAGLRFAR